MEQQKKNYENKIEVILEENKNLNDLLNERIVSNENLKT